jgi:hypothetical protein
MATAATPRVRKVPRLRLTPPRETVPLVATTAAGFAGGAGWPLMSGAMVVAAPAPDVSMLVRLDCHDGGVTLAVLATGVLVAVTRPLSAASVADWF